jgi:hypothetical protein
MSDPLKSALAVLDAYMAGLNRGDEVAVNAACNFPHVRIAGGQVVVWQKRGEYKLDDFRARAGDGWARSQWDERTPIHVGADKVHLKVKFSRFRKDGSRSANSRRSTSSPARTATGHPSPLFFCLVRGC